MELKQSEMEIINGGAISSPVLNAITKAINALYELGRQTGSTIRRLVKNQYCPLN